MSVVEILKLCDEAPKDLLFRGRPEDPRLGELGERLTHKLPDKATGFVLIGFPDDEGVTRNRGRSGAGDGPNATRKYFYKLCPPMNSDWKDFQFFDAGNVKVGSSIDVTHTRVTEVCAELASLGSTLIAVGGGHDFAAPLTLGVHQAFSRNKTKAPKFGVINIDPHLDVRPLENGLPHSGTPFRVLLESPIDLDYTAFGIRPNRNAKAHFEYAKSKKVTVHTWEAVMQKGVIKAFNGALTRTEQKSEVVGLTIDMDACFETEGTSAAPVLGFSAWEICQMAYLAGRSKKVKWLELAEAAPKLDFNERVARIASEVIYFFIQGRMEQKSRTFSSKNKKTSKIAKKRAKT